MNTIHKNGDNFNRTWESITAGVVAKLGLFLFPGEESGI